MMQINNATAIWKNRCGDLIDLVTLMEVSSNGGNFYLPFFNQEKIFSDYNPLLQECPGPKHTVRT